MERHAKRKENKRIHAFRETVGRELRRIASRKLYLFVLIGLPLFSLAFMATIFGNGQIENVPIGIVDQTNSEFTREIVRTVAAVPTFKVENRHFYTDEHQARKALQKMDIAAYLVIPPDFDSKVFNHQNAPLVFYNHYAVLSTGEETNGAFTNVLANISASVLAKTGQAVGLTQQQVQSVVMPASQKVFPIYNPDLDFSVYISHPFFFVFFQIIILVVTVYMIGTEIKKEPLPGIPVPGTPADPSPSKQEAAGFDDNISSGTGQPASIRAAGTQDFGKAVRNDFPGSGEKSWLETAGGDIFIAVFGKLLPYFVIFSMESIFANYIFFGVMHIPFSCNFGPLIASGILLVIASLAVGVFLISLIPNLSIAISFASMFGALGATMCGVTFPIESMYPAVRFFSYFFPVRYFTLISHSLLYNDAGYAYTWPFYAALLLFTVPALVLLPRLKKSLLRSRPAEDFSLLYTGRSIFYSELTHISRSYGVLLIILGGTIGYSLLYNLLYKPNIVEKVPIAVVDNSRSELSRKYTRYLDATQGISVLTNAVDFPRAKELMKSRKIHGIIFLPYNFSDRIHNGEESVFLMYETTTSFLYYLTIQESALTAMQKINGEYREDIVRALPLPAQLALSQAPSIPFAGIPLYNWNAGYGSFLIPVVSIVILFQTLLMAIGVMNGHYYALHRARCSSGNLPPAHDFPREPLRERTIENVPEPAEPETKRLLKRKKISGIRRKSRNDTFTVVFNRTAVYIIIYFLLSFFVVGLMPGVFNMPHIGNPWIIFPFILLFLTVTAFAGMAFSYFFRDSESAILMIPFFSIGLIFLAGVSFPIQQTSLFWRIFFYLFPSSPAINGYVKLNTLGGDIGTITPEIITLLIQGLVYFFLAILVQRALYGRRSLR